MADSTANFYLSSNFNVNFDITWSFQYAITGLSASGGFSTFLFDTPVLTGGGNYTGFGLLPYSTKTGVSGHYLGIIFDSQNTIKIYKGTTFSLLTSFSLFPSLSPLIKNVQEYNTIRFNLTNVSQTLDIAVKDKETNRYKTLASINTSLTANETKFCKIGFSYSTPLSAGGNKCLLKFKDIHIQGRNKFPTIDYSEKPYILPKEETYYLIQSPTSGLINIGSPDPITTGSLLQRKS